MNSLSRRLKAMEAAEHAKVLSGKPKNAWVPYICQGVEVSCVHTSFPHGLISLGWGGTHKVILLDCAATEDYKKKEIKLITNHILLAAKELAVVLNTKYPKGLPVQEH